MKLFSVNNTITQMANGAAKNPTARPASTPVNAEAMWQNNTTEFAAEIELHPERPESSTPLQRSRSFESIQTGPYSDALP